METAPLRTVGELLSWTPPPRGDPRAASVPLPRPPAHGSAPRLLACHDLRGNYGEDRFTQGGNNADFYRLTRWDKVDTFSYFSHNLVTIPPVGWVHAAHRNGARALGTLITEWDRGRDACEQLLSTPDGARRVAAQLARIADRLGFDGWLVNIENCLSPEAVRNLLVLLSELRALLRPASGLLIWYDAVTVEGRLEWQNTLSSRNAPFFSACDAIFVNYSWVASTPTEVAARAGSRRADVYMGIDVYGRHTFAGGRMNSRVAVEAAQREGLSVALFAIAWAYEESSRSGDATEAWMAKDGELWDTIPHERATLLTLPFHSDFCPGAGKFLSQAGGCRVSDLAWYNLSMQAPMPACLGDARADLSGERVWSGSASLRVRPGAGGACQRPAGPLTLFRADVEVPARGLLVTARISRAGAPPAHGTGGAHASLLLRGTCTKGGWEERVHLAPARGVREWSTSSAVVGSGIPRAILHGVWLDCGDERGELFLGSLTLSSPEDIPGAGPAARVWHSHARWTYGTSISGEEAGVLDAELGWEGGAGAARWHVWSEDGSSDGPKWLGVAHARSFSVRGLPACPPIGGSRLLVQAEAVDGTVESLDRCPSTCVPGPGLTVNM